MSEIFLSNIIKLC